MPVTFPPLLKLGGEEAFAAYQAEFDRLYRAGPVEDVLGRRVVFNREDCEHVCKKGPPGGLRVWAQERAERIPWIGPALRQPGSLRPSHTMEGRQVYLVEGVTGLAAPGGWERFIVVVEPEGGRRAKRVTFVSAFPPDTVGYWKQALLQGPRLYPAKRR